jgi:tetratricopeptide (TPR) repeat protein/Mrp family chromosome partitioning ATPase
VTLPPDARTTGARIITFYSYKGGTGRTMTLSNVAWVLASQGRKVLAVDWDLEAPGLHRYFRPFLIDPELSATDGIIDMVIEYSADAVTSSEASSKDWYLEYADPTRYAVMVHQFENGGRVDLLAAGRQGWSYSVRVNTFDWRDFYEKKGGGAFLEAVEARMRASYDYVLIDSRTGVSDTSGICTVQFPDALVVCFTLNDQSIEGASAVAASVLEQRRDSAPEIYPVPMRVELAEKQKLERRRELCRVRFALFPNTINDPTARSEYWNSVETLYVPFYAYEEILAAVGDRPDQPSSLLGAAERLAYYISHGEVQRMAPLAESTRLDLLARYERRVRVVPEESLGKEAESIYMRLSQEQQHTARQLFTRLIYIARPGKVGRDTPVPAPMADLPELSPAESGGLNAFFAGGILRLEQDPDTGTPLVAIANPALLTRWDRMARWIREDRAFLAWRQQLEDQKRVWEQSADKNKTVLLGTALNEAQKWAGERSTELTPAERDYVRASVQASRAASKSQHLRNGVISAAALLVFAALLWVGLRERRKNQAITRVATADTLAQAGQRDSAIAVLLHAVQMNSGLEAAHRRLGDLYRDGGQMDSALAHYEAAISLDESNADAYFGRGVARESKGLLDGAVEDYSQTIKLDSANIDAWFARGAAFQSLDRPASAIPDFLKVIELNPDARTRAAANARLTQLGFNNTLPAAVALRIYLHYTNPADAGVVSSVERALEGQGFNVAGVELRSEYTRGDVRSFFASDRAGADSVARAIEVALAREGYRVTLERAALDSANFPAAQRGQIEAWLPVLMRPVSSAPQQVAMCVVPKLVGETAAQASRLLRRVNLRPAFEDTVASNAIATEQNPQAGARIRCGSVVRVRFGSAK